MLKSFETLRSRFDRRQTPALMRGARDFVAAAALLGSALYLALQSETAVSRGQPSLGIALSIAALVLALIAAVITIPSIVKRIRFNRWLLPMSFSITREGAIYLLCVIVMSLAAINSGNNLLFLILAFLLSAIITSGIFARASLRSVSVSMDVPENVFVGDKVAIKVSLRNRKRFFPSVSISIEDLGLRTAILAGNPDRRGKSTGKEQDRPVLHHTAYFPLIPPGGTRTELVSQTFPTRGRYRLEGFRISTRFPFGIFKRGERVRAGGEVLVYPAVQEVSSYFHLLPFRPGRLEGRQVGPGESLHSIRKYFDGDSARLVDWKATAKTGELMSRQYAREEESKFCLIFDTAIDPLADDKGTKGFENAVSLAASLAAHFSDDGAEVEFLTPGEYIPRGIGRNHLYRILRSLAVLQPGTRGIGTTVDMHSEFGGVVDSPTLQEILSEKVFKIILTQRARGGFPATVWRSSHVVYYNEL